jgi:hypothetical protein
MSAGIIIAIGIVLVAALGVGLTVARRAGEEIGPEANYGRELEAQPRAGRGRGALSPAARRRAMVAIFVAALAALGAGLATAVSLGPQ